MTPTNPNKLIFFFLSVLLLWIQAACTGASGNIESQDSSLRIVATTTIVGDIVRQVAGNLMQVETLLPVGTDPHAFEPRPQDVAAITDADLIFANGAGLEEFLEPLLQNAGTQAQVIQVSAGIALLPFEESSHAASGAELEDDAYGEHTFDPHTWMDPNNVIVWVYNIAAALSSADPQNASIYDSNAEAYIQSLQELDAWIDQQTNRLPAERRKLVSDHRTLGYFASAYGFEIVGELVASVSTNAQTSAQELALLEDQIRLFDVPAIFVDQAINPVLAEQVAQDSGILLVRIYTGSLGGADSPASSYLEMMRYNVSEIVTALTP